MWVPSVLLLERGKFSCMGHVLQLEHDLWNCHGGEGNRWGREESPCSSSDLFCLQPSHVYFSCLSSGM